MSYGTLHPHRDEISLPTIIRFIRSRPVQIERLSDHISGFRSSVFGRASGIGFRPEGPFDLF